MSKKPTVLMILDGFGLNDNPKANAVYEAKTPNIDRIMAEYPFVKGNASGLAVGLPDGQMGNSEVGHLNMAPDESYIRSLQESPSPSKTAISLRTLLFFRRWRTVRRTIPPCICTDSYLTAVYTVTIPIFTVC